MTAARTALPTTRLLRRRRAWSGWWMGLLVAIAANLAVIAVLVRISHVVHPTQPAPNVVQRINEVEPPPPDEPEPLETPSEEPEEAPPPLALALPALDLAVPTTETAFSLPSLPISDQPVELPAYLPAFSAVASDATPGIAAPQAIAGATLAFDEPPVLAAGFDLQRFYPRQARLRGVEGDTVLRFEIAADGSITRTTVVSSTPNGVFEQAAERLARSLRFTPAKRGGVAVPSLLTQHIVWKLER